jgi:HAD superfamily hydrolase (TIGR01509 family)
LPEFKGLIFDFNGVLLWDNELHEAAWHIYSARLRGYPLALEEMHAHVHGRVNADIFAYLLGEPVAIDELERLAEEKESIYRELFLTAKEPPQLSPGAIELLDDLHDNRISMAIATSSSEPNVKFYVHHLQLDRWFPPERLVYDQGSFPGKPAPDIYLEAARRLGLHPRDCIVIEDSLAGIQSAGAAGVGWIIALGPEERHQVLSTVPEVNELIQSLQAFDTQRVQGLR